MEDYYVLFIFAAAAVLVGCVMVGHWSGYAAGYERGGHDEWRPRTKRRAPLPAQNPAPSTTKHEVKRHAGTLQRRRVPSSQAQSTNAVVASATLPSPDERALRLDSRCARWFATRSRWGVHRDYATADANRRLVEQGIKLGNPSQCVRQSLTARRVFAVQRGRFRVSQLGRQYLRQLMGDAIPES